MIIMKFGGTSVAGADRLLHVASIIVTYRQKNQVCVVVSALAGVTNTLLGVVSDLRTNSVAAAYEKIDSLQQMHRSVLDDLQLSPSNELETLKQLVQLMSSLRSYVSQLAGTEITAEHSDFIATFGERLSSLLLVQAVEKRGVASKAMDSARLIVSSSHFGNGRALLSNTKKQCHKALFPLLEKGITPIITGFYGTTRAGKIVTLGRGGSDYSASVLANVCNADELIIWKEVDGVFSADPHQHADAQFLPKLTYEKAAFMARAGAKVLHPETMEPARKKNIVIWVKNTFKPEFTGTKIYNAV